MVKSKKQMRTALQAEWVAEGEELRCVLGEKDVVGHLGATIGGRFAVPHQPLGPVPELDVDHSSLAPPSRPVREGKFHGDEWIHDPAMRGWVSRRARINWLCAAPITSLLLPGGGTSRPIVVPRSSTAPWSPGQAESESESAAAERKRGVGPGQARSAFDAVASCRRAGEDGEAGGNRSALTTRCAIGSSSSAEENLPEWNIWISSMAPH